MNWRCPPSCAFDSKTACAVVPDPPKKSRMMSSLEADNVKQRVTKPTGFGLSKTPLPNKLASCSLAKCVWPTSSYFQTEPGVLPALTSERKVLTFAVPFPSAPNQIRFSSSNSRNVVWLKRGHLPSGAVHSLPFLKTNV